LLEFFIETSSVVNPTIVFEKASVWAKLEIEYKDQLRYILDNNDESANPKGEQYLFYF
jgi:hypothetical protein